MDMKKVGQRLRLARTAKLWKQEDLAERTGLGVSHISRIETGQKRGVNFETMARIAAALDVSLDEIASAGEDEEHRGKKVAVR